MNCLKKETLNDFFPSSTQYLVNSLIKLFPTLQHNRSSRIYFMFFRHIFRDNSRSKSQMNTKQCNC